jgi:hypothetical protein
VRGVFGPHLPGRELGLALSGAPKEKAPVGVSGSGRAARRWTQFSWRRVSTQWAFTLTAKALMVATAATAATATIPSVELISWSIVA